MIMQTESRLFCHHGSPWFEQDIPAKNLSSDSKTTAGHQQSLTSHLIHLCLHSHFWYSLTQLQILAFNCVSYVPFQFSSTDLISLEIVTFSALIKHAYTPCTTSVHILRAATLNGILLFTGKNGLADNLLQDPSSLGLIFCSIIHLMRDLKV